MSTGKTPPAEPTIALREGWAWEQDAADDNTWQATSLNDDERSTVYESTESVRWEPNTKSIVVSERCDDIAGTYDDVILAVLEANASPALEEYRRRADEQARGSFKAEVDRWLALATAGSERIEELQRLLTNAEGDARILAHAYEHDTRPPPDVVARALAYRAGRLAPADPEGGPTE